MESELASERQRRVKGVEGRIEDENASHERTRRLLAEGLDQQVRCEARDA